MTASSTLIRTFALLCCLCAFAPSPARAHRSDDDRMAGREVPSPEKAVEKNHAATEPKHRPAVGARRAEGHGDLNRIESFGLLTGPKDGGLGIDMWDGSDRGAVIGLIQQLPSSFTYKTSRDLVRRVLLTKADVTMLGHKDSDSAGQNLMTLRIQKLMDMGALDDAASLYKENPYSPYNAEMADTGVLALMYSGQGALGCLETEAMRSRFADDRVWREMTGFCDYLLIKTGAGKNAADKSYGPAIQSGSRLVRQVMAKNDFRYAPRSVAELEALTPLEKAVLAADHRIDYSALRRLGSATFSPSTLALITHDSAAPLDFRFELMQAAVRAGISSPADLGSFYKSLPFRALADDSGKLDGINGINGWQRIAWLYKSADINRGRINGPVLKAALPLAGEYGLYALQPFASLLADASPEGLSPESIRTGVLLALDANAPLSVAWAQQWKKNDSNVKNEFLVRIAYEIVSDSHSEDGADYHNLLSEIKSLPIQQEQLIKMLLEKLDNGRKLHNIDASKVYENTVDLTQNVSYVMPSVGLMSRFATAVNDKQLGEAVLLGSIALHGVPPAKMFAGMFRGVINGFETVGLTKEAREIAKEVILGLGK
jgi:hypothetical protein